MRRRSGIVLAVLLASASPAPGQGLDEPPPTTTYGQGVRGVRSVGAAAVGVASAAQAVQAAGAGAQRIAAGQAEGAGDAEALPQHAGHVGMRGRLLGEEELPPTRETPETPADPAQSLRDWIRAGRPADLERLRKQLPQLSAAERQALHVALRDALAERPPVKGNPRALTAADSPLQRAAQAAELLAESLGPGEVDALIEAAEDFHGAYRAGPELHAALAAVAARHPDPALRERAGQGAADVAHDAHLVDLRRTVHELNDEGKRGVEIWSEIARRSVDFHLPRTDITDEQRYDEVIADLGRVFNGPATKNLETYYRWFGRLPGADPNLLNTIQTVKAHDWRLGWAGGGIDPTHSEDFRGAFNDGTNNQVFHTNFFQLLGYATASKDPRLVNLPNIKHETLDPGGSVPDWIASAAGLQVGNFIRQLRDQGKGEAGLRAIPAIIGGAYSNHPRDFARPWGPTGPDYTAVVDGMSEAMPEVIRHPYGQGAGGKFAARFQRGLVRVLNWDFSR